MFTPSRNHGFKGDFSITLSKHFQQFSCITYNAFDMHENWLQKTSVEQTFRI